MRLLTPADLRGLDAGALGELLERTGLLVAAGDGELNGLAAAALLAADYAVLDLHTTLHLDDSPEVWAAVKGRLGRGALGLLLRDARSFSADEALSAGLCDEVIHEDPHAWLERWMRQRSTLALDTAATLLRARGGDALERAAFARLFAIGEPQKGLAAFLEKRKPVFESTGRRVDESTRR